MGNKSIVFLWAEVTGYVCGVLESIRKSYSVEVDVVHWDVRNANSTQYQIPDSQSIRYHGRSVTDQQQVLDILISCKPSIIVVSGWMDKGYIWACRRYKNKFPEVKIVAGIDDQWTGSIRQRVGQFYYHIFYRNLFDYMWVAGKAQFAFANRFGYGQNNILNNIYSGQFIYSKPQERVNRRFIYVGRCIYSKGVDLLISAHKNLPNNIRNEWPLLIIGTGELKDYISKNCDNSIIHMAWLQPPDLAHELCKGGVGCMPSRREQWGVTIHEYSQHGLPLLLSNVCGAANELLINGYNGYSFMSDDVKDLTNKMLKISSLTNAEIKKMGENSLLLGKKISPDISAASLLSVLEN
jgi:glycosyltransferase involved in cell wall biosynthesis